MDEAQQAQAMYEASVAAAMYSGQQYGMMDQNYTPVMEHQMQMMSLMPNGGMGSVHHEHGHRHGQTYRREPKSSVDMTDLLPDPKTIPWSQIESRATALAFEKLGSMALQVRLRDSN
jgi:hypothetical protein